MLPSILKKSSLMTVPKFIASKSPLLWFKFDESAGTTATDSGSLGNNGTATVSGILGQSPVYTPAGYGVLIGSTSQYVTFSATGTQFTTARTLGVITDLDSTPSTSVSRAIYNEGNNGVSGEQGWSVSLIGVTPTTYAVRFSYWDGSDFRGMDYAISLDGAALVGKHTYVIAIEGLISGDNVTVYQDGVSLGTQALTANVDISTVTRRIALIDANSIWIGTFNHWFYTGSELSASDAAYFHNSFLEYG